MGINIGISNETTELKPRITVFGVGGAGGNAVNNMINSELDGVEFVVANTDAQALVHAATERRIQLGGTLTQGLGAGSKPEIGRAAAEETIDEIMAQLDGSHMVFIAAGMGGGTGTGAAPVIARAARDNGILTVGVVTKPFQFEGPNRMRLAEKGIEELEQYVDTLIIIPNQNLFRVANEKTTFADAFTMADEVLHSGVRGVTDLMVMPGLINLDFADVRSVMSEMGKAMMGTGEAEGERRSLDAAEAAISNPLLDDTSMAGANGVLINITGGMDMTLFEVDEAANRIRAEVDSDANIIFGSTFDPTMDGKMRVSVVATGIDRETSAKPVPTMLDVTTEAVASTPVPAEDIAPEEEAAALEDAMEAATAEPQVPDFLTEGGVPAEPQADLLAGAEAESAVETVSEAIMEQAPVQAEAAYIPPKPVEATGSAAAFKADPFAEADLLNGASEAHAHEQDAPAVEEVKKPFGKVTSLFERVTGSGGSRDVKAEAAAPQQGGLNPGERLQTSEPSDELLDIPSFLRRQAN